MVTSCVGDEGKTTTISNLAIALARAGHRVALVDLDLRKPMIGRFFGLELRPGLADAAIERIELEQALVPIGLVAAEPIFAAAPRHLPVTDEAPGGPKTHGEGQLYVLPPGSCLQAQASSWARRRLRDPRSVARADGLRARGRTADAHRERRRDALHARGRDRHGGAAGPRDPMLRDLARELDASPAPKLGFILTGAAVTEQYGYGTRGRGDMSQGRSRPRRRPRSPSAPRALAEQPSSPPSGLIEAEGTGSARAAGEHAPVVTVSPTYNRASTLGRQYESLAQSFRDFEWVIVDDGSEDDTQALVKSWADDGKLEIRYHAAARSRKTCGRQPRSRDGAR